MGAPSLPEIIGRYAIYGRLASGGMASVHFGRLIGGAGFSRTVAIKRLHPHLAEDPEFLSTMIDEARLAARIHHPNVVPTLDVVATDGELLLVMEYVRGESLARLLKAETGRGARIPLTVGSAIVIGALHGLHAAHEATSDRGEPLGIVHRDISPHNLLVGTDGVARVIDFGVAKAAGRIQTTREGVVKGKLAYMAPEQVNGESVGPAADIYAMGVVFWEVLAGRRLFEAENDAVLMRRVLTGPTSPPSAYVPGVPPAVDAIVMRALAREPAARYGTALEMAEELLRAAPPAFSTDVGRWCVSAAGDSLAQRGVLLAEIEGHSGIGPIARDAPEGAAPATRPERSGSRPRFTREELAASAALAADDGPTVASESRSSAITVEAPQDTVREPRSQTWAVAAGVAGALVAIALSVSVYLLVRSRPEPEPVAASSFAPSVATAPPAPAPPPPAATVEVPAPPASVAATASAPPPPPPSPAHATVTSAPPASHTPTTTPPATTHAACNPPYEFDAEGHKKWKRQCL